MKTVMTAIVVCALLTPVPLSGQEDPPDVSLHLATLQGNVAAVRQHLEAGSDPNAQDAWGSTPLIIAATFGRTEVARALIEAGADMDIANSDGATPLRIAAFLCRSAIVRALLTNGADRFVRDNVGNTALDAVAAPFDDVRAIYDVIGRALRPLGLVLDYEHIRRTRPQIGAMLRPEPEALRAVEYAPLPGDDWNVSTPSEQGLDPMLVAELYLDAAHVSNLYALLVIKNGYLIAERYFNDGAIDRNNVLQSVTKSYTSALVGIALEQGCLTSVDQQMMEFFPELADQLDDPRKDEITIRHLLQMRAGYPWEEREPPYFDLLFMRNDWRWVPHIVDFPLSSDPGTRFGYSNLTSHILAVILARACDADLASYAQEHLLSTTDAQLGSWSRDADNYRFGSFEISATARDVAKFGLLYLNDGEYRGIRILPAEWVRESLRRYSEGMYDNAWESEASHYQGPYLRDVGYGYQWWSGRVGRHRFDFARGHGGQLIILLDELDTIIVSAADPLYDFPSETGWRFEAAILNLVGKFIKSLPDG